MGTASWAEGSVATLETESGSTYVIDTGQMTLTRTRNAPQTLNETLCHELHRDGDEIRIVDIACLMVGRRGVFVLEPLGHPELTNATIRSTTAFVSIRWTASCARASGVTEDV